MCFLSVLKKYFIKYDIEMIRDYLIKYYLQTRNYIKSCWCPISWVERDNVKYDNSLILFFINYIPQYFLFSFLGYFNFNFLYAKDGIYYHYPSYNPSIIQITKPILNISINNNNNNFEVTDNFSQFDNSTPIYIMLNHDYQEENNLLNIDDNYDLEIEYFDEEIKSKKFNIKKIKNRNINTILNL